MKIFPSRLIYSVSFILISTCLSAQFSFPSLSPKGKLSQQVGNTLIDIEYERPSVRKRIIFGELVPWNQVWRTGAGHCTKISFDRPIMVGHQPVDAGKYSLHTIPNKNHWIVILNSDTTLYGSYGYDSAKDVARFQVTPRKTDRHYETLTIDIDIIPNDAKVYISWSNTQISFDIHTAMDERTKKYIDNALISGQSEDPDEYGLAADYLLYQNVNYYDALRLADMMIQKGGNEGWARNIKINIYDRLHLYDAALGEIEKAMENVRNSQYEEEIYRSNDLKELEKRTLQIMKKVNGQ